MAAETTTVRVRRPDSERLQSLAKARQIAVVDVVHAAIDALERQEFLRGLNGDYQRLRNNRASEKFVEFTQDKGGEHILSPVVHPVVAAILDEPHSRTLIKQKRLNREAKHEPEPDNKAAFRKILKHNKRWVSRPVPILAKTLHPLWAHVMVAGVPAAPIAACLLLAWTIVLTGDELDTRGPFPNFYRPGLLTIA